MSRQRHTRLLQSGGRADRCCRNLSPKTRLCASHYAKSQQQRDRVVHSRESSWLLSSGPKEVPRRARKSSITIGNKSKADGTIACRARHDGWPISHPSLNPPRTIRLFSANTKRYTSPNVIVILGSYATRIFELCRRLLRQYLSNLRQFEKLAYLSM
jgi:hypothetical protein